MEIFHIIESYQKDGTSSVIRDICRLTDPHTTHTIINLSSSYDLQAVNELQSYPNIKFRSFDYVGDTKYTLRHYWRLYLKKEILHNKFRNVIRFIAENDHDIIHFHTNPRELMLARYLNSDVPFLFTDHLVRIKPDQYPWINQFGLLLLYRKLYAQFHLSAVSGVVAGMHSTFKLQNPEKLSFTILNAIDTDKYIPGRQVRNENTEIIYIARLEKIKGHEVLIQALGKIKEVPFHLSIVGDGSQRENLKVLTESLGLSKKITFTGIVDDPLQLLQMADFAVFPSFLEGLPLSLLEKMSCGLPVICSDIEELRSVVEDGYNGLVFSAGDTNELKEKILYLIANPEERTRIGESAREYVLKNHALKDFGKNYNQVYRRIVNAG